MEETRQVFFETRGHASRPYISNYPPSISKLNSGSTGGFLTRGFSQLKERWSDYRQPTRSRKCASLFVSPSGDLVAVATGSQITILRKDNDYQEPYGTFMCGNKGVFVHGAWSEGHEILGVADDTDVVYFIKANGEEISRLTKKHLKVSNSIIGLIVQDNTEMKESCLCHFSVATSDGSLHRIEISPDPNASIVSSDSFISSLLLKHQLSQNIFCVDYHKASPLFATICETVSPQMARSSDLESYSISIWRRRSKSNVEHLSSSQFEGLYSRQKDHVGQLTFPKVLLSPQGNHVACLDVRGGLVIFKFDAKHCALSKLIDGREQRSQVTDDSRSGECFVNIIDFSWWSDDIISIANRTGTVSMFDIFTGDKVLENDYMYSMPLLDRAQQLDGFLLLLESTSTEVTGDRNSNLTQHVVDGWDPSKSGTLQWQLFSFTKRTLPDMYNLLISSQEYQAALDFASRHRLDKDEVLKSQWQHSLQGVNEINKFLSSINDQAFVISECVNQVGPSEAAVRALLTLGLQVTDCYRFPEFKEDNTKVWDYRVARLKLLHLRDRLETFLGISMGRFTLQEFKRFRDLPMKEPAIELAESGKIGALNLLFKRHFYSLAPVMLDVLAAIPETVHVQSYSQLLPGCSSPSISVRETDWVECHQMISFINTHSEIYESSIHVRTEYVVKQCIGFEWPSIMELELWYKSRARSIDTLSGQLENSMCLIELAFNKGLSGLQQFLEDISYLHQLIYSDGSEGLNFSMDLVAWEQLSDYDKFKSMLSGINEKNVIDRLNRRGIPFMQKKFHSFTMTNNASNGIPSSIDNKTVSFLVRWLKEIAVENKLDMCLLVIEEGCCNSQSGFFTDEAEVVDCALQCIYLCSASDKWSTMASILSKLPHRRDFEGIEDMKRRLKVAESHVEAGRLLAVYQVPKPISFMLEANSDEKGVKQILRLILSKFIRRQTGRLDTEWASMWRDLQSLQEKAFPFLDMEFLLIEFCRGLLKAGKFSLARNYLKGAGPVALAADKAESLVIQAAREYFFSASSLSCSEIWKAKECLNIFPNSRNVRAEVDIIEAVTVKLPGLGVNLLPVQFRQIKDPMEIIKLAITSQPGAYLHVEELIEISKLLGLSSHDDISSVQEALAREAAVAGDLQLSFDLCLVLARKGHGSVWDLCAALARGPALENTDVSSRKQLLGFALSHCDGESIGELLNAWKDLDLQGQCDTLSATTGKEPPKVVTRGSSIINYSSEISEDIDGMSDFAVEGYINDDTNNQGAQIEKIKKILSQVAKNASSDHTNDLDSLLRESGKLTTFASLVLPWLMELSQDTDYGQKSIPISASGKQHISVRTQAIVAILCWLARSGLAPRDDFIAKLARSVMEPPVTEEEDLLGCSYLLNLEDALHGVEVIEEHVKTRDKYNEISSIMDLGVLYSFLHSCEAECKDPDQKRELLLKTFQQRNNPMNSDDRSKLDEAQSTFWRDWKLKLEEQKRVAEQSKVLEQIIPGVDTGRFISRDREYINSVLSSLIESVKVQKKAILKNVIQLADSYGLNRSMVLLHYVSCILVSEFWSIEDVITEISDFREEICACTAESIKVLSSVYAEIDGLDKQRLAFIYGLLSDCYLCLEEKQKSESTLGQNFKNADNIRLAHFCKTVGEECSRISLIKDLNFKNIAGLNELNFDCLNNEVLAHINEANVEALAEMVQNLLDALKVPNSKGILSGQYVYTHHVESILNVLETRASSEIHPQIPEDLLHFISEIEHTYNSCRRFFRLMETSGLWKEMTRFFSIIVRVDESWRNLSHDAIWHNCLVALLDFWIKLMNDIQDFQRDLSLHERFPSQCPVTCVKSFLSLVIGGKISTSQGWASVFCYVNNGLMTDLDVEILNFCRAMILSGCQFDSVATVFSEAVPSSGPGFGEGNQNNDVQGLCHTYLSILESILRESSGGSIRKETLHNFMSSLRKLEGDLESLRNVRLAVWENLAEFSENLQLPSHVRVQVLELMQHIAGSDRQRKGMFPVVHSDVTPWEGWEDSQCSNASQMNSTKDGLEEAAADGTNRFTNTLIALKSSQLVSTISRSLEITPEDLSSVESAISCFSKISEGALSESHIGSLLAMLKEWENLFTSRKTETGSNNLADVENNWNNDEWDNEGWDDFQEEPVEKESTEDHVFSVHPLHACWALLFKKVIILSQFGGLIHLVDKYMAQTSQTLLDEDDVSSLSQTLLELDCFLAVKLALLFPYETVQLQCLDAFEKKLKRDGMCDKIGEDQELFSLVLSSGIVSTIITKPCYDTTFSCLCYLVGNFSRQCQDTLMASHKHGPSEVDSGAKNFVYLFTRVLFPCYLAELVKADQQILAAFLLTKYMHTNASLSLISVADVSLRKYLERQVEMVQNDAILLNETNCGSVLNSLSRLKLRLGSLLKSSLSLLSADVR